MRHDSRSAYFFIFSKHNLNQRSNFKTRFLSKLGKSLSCLTLGQDEIAKYPFLADAGQYLKDKGFTLEQFGSDPDLKQLIDKAFERIQLQQMERSTNLI